VIHIPFFQTDALQQVSLPKFITHPLSPVLVTRSVHRNFLRITVLLPRALGDLYELQSSAYSSIYSSLLGSYIFLTLRTLLPSIQ
jgi:hypothetical protein